MDVAFSDPIGAFVPHGRLRRNSTGGPLADLSVAVKDLFDWKGVPTGAGNPTWLETHPVPEVDSAAVAALAAAGANLYGKTVTDELAYSIHGDNIHYGTPLNSAAPGRVCGGSSSGSAAAVAAGLVDVALGTDTGGSVRVPAAYCGLFGIRTTHGLIDRSGLVPLAPSFDTVGWLARDAATLARLGDVLVPAGPELGDDERTLADAETVAEEFGGLEGLRQTYVTLQGFEAWQSHGAWITAAHPAFAEAIAVRFQVAARVTLEQANRARARQERFRAAFRRCLGTGVLRLPAAAGPAPLLGEQESRVDAVRVQTMRLTCLAGLAGLPQVTVPYRGPDGLPLGLGLIGPAGSDRALIARAALVAKEF